MEEIWPEYLHDWNVLKDVNFLPTIKYSKAHDRYVFAIHNGVVLDDSVNAADVNYQSQRNMYFTPPDDY